jgi:hypothetical protein
MQLYLAMLGRDVHSPVRATALILLAAAGAHRARSVPAASACAVLPFPWTFLFLWTRVVGAPENPAFKKRKFMRDRHDYGRWAEFDGGKRGAGQGKEG